MLLQDLKFAVRVQTKQPAFTLLIVLILAIGIGATSAMFTALDVLVLRPLPYASGSRLVYGFGRLPNVERGVISPADFLDYRALSRSFSSLAAMTPFGTAVLSGEGEPERVDVPFVTANFFDVLAVRPIIGRAFLPGEEEGQHKIVVLSNGLWQRRFGADPTVLGKTIALDGEPYVVVGVMPAVLGRTFHDQLWRPLPFHIPETEVRGARAVRMLGKLRPGATLDGAQHELDLISRQLELTYPDDRGARVELVPYREVVVGGAAPAILILFGGASLLLLIACSNVAALLLARATTREGEIAVRAALGASQIRIIRQLVSESLLLGLCGGVGGLLVSIGLVQTIRHFAAAMLPRAAEMGINGTAVLFTAGITLLTTLVCGLVPAHRAARSNLAGSTRSLVRSSSGRRTLQLRDTLVIAQVALSLILLIAAGLLLRSVILIEGVNPGFDKSNLLTAQVTLPVAGYESRVAVERFWNEFRRRVSATPGVEHVAGATMIPLLGGSDRAYRLEAESPLANMAKRSAQTSVVTDDYFATMRIRTFAGRTFGPADAIAQTHSPTGSAADKLSSGTAVISHRMARQLYPHGTAIGEHIVIDLGRAFTAEIVGVVDDVHAYGQATEPPDVIYLSQRQVEGDFDGRSMYLVVRSSRDPDALTPTIRNVLHDVEPRVPLANVSSMEHLLRDSIADSYFRLRLLMGFAAISLLLAVAGLYGALAFIVTQRRREIGIRLALGADARRVIWSVAGHAMRLVIIGSAAGLVGALAGSRFLTGLLFNVTSVDPVVFASVVSLILLSGLIASVVPAWRALRISPVAALKEEG